ncbi:MAG: cytochrome C [Methyloceanibacter sp.]
MGSMRLGLMLAAVALIGTGAAVEAQDVGNVPVGEIGDPQAGFEYASANCGGCHAISQEAAPDPKAPRFRDVANTAGMTPTAIRVWLQSFHHPTMPNIVVEGQELRNLTAYILSLKD